MFRIRTGETDFLDLLLAESASLLKESAAFSSHHALVSESEHPHGTEDFVREFAIPDAMGLVITFDRYDASLFLGARVSY